MTRTEATRRIKQDGRINTAKSRLLEVLRDLERDGLARDAERLSGMIGRIEDWQNN